MCGFSLPRVSVVKNQNHGNGKRVIATSKNEVRLGHNSAHGMALREANFHL